MEITYNLVNNIIKKMPIGYYLQRRLNKIILSETATSTSYDLISDSITISYKNIKDMVSNYESISQNTFGPQIDIETIIRGLVYHEVSHAILTPIHLLDFKFINRSRSFSHNVINVFEDERIETLLADFYMNTNFKRNIVLLNNYQGEDPKTPFSAFYHAVRYRQYKFNGTGRKNFLTRIDAIINQFRGITATTKNNNEISHYGKAIEDLYNDLTQDWIENTGYEGKDEDGNDKLLVGILTDDTPDSSNTNDSEDGETPDVIIDARTKKNKSSNSENNADKKPQKVISKGSKESSEEEDENKDSKLPSNEENKDENEDKDELPDKLKDLIDDILKQIETASYNKYETSEAIKALTKKYDDPNLTNKLQNIIDNKLRKSRNNGNAINTYSGLLDPRSVYRDDYKWWLKKNANGSIKRYSKVHFTFYIDNSGSFSNNEDPTNTFIQSLAKINNKDFSFDIVTINETYDEWTTYERLFTCDGGNHLGDDILPVIKRHHKPQANNYDIVMFDGDAHTADYYHRSSSYYTRDPFRHFDSPNTIMVVDPSNRKYIEPSVHSARVIYTNNYLVEFIDSTLTLLDRVI